MNIKRLMVVGLTAAMAAGMTGCGDDITLTTEQNDLIAEYAAGTMLKYSYDNKWKYEKANIAVNTYSSNGHTAATIAPGISNNNPTTAVGSSNSGTTISPGSTSTTTDPMDSLSNCLGLSGCSITYGTYSVGDRYPTGEYVICVPANNDCKVVAVEFNIKNSTSAVVNASTNASKVNMKLTISGTAISQSTSMLKNDIIGLSNISIGQGETYKAVAIFQVPESSTGNIAGSALSIYSNGSSVGSITLN